MTPSELLACAPRIAPSKLARIRLLKCKSLGTLVPPGRDGKFLTIALDGKRGPPVRRLPKDVELVEQAAPPPPKLEPQCVNCGAVATLKCSACAAVDGRCGARQSSAVLSQRAEIVDFRPSQVAAWATRAAIGGWIAPSTPGSHHMRTAAAVGGELGTAATVLGRLQRCAARGVARRDGCFDGSAKCESVSK